MFDISVIIPVFNAENYIERCINCLKKQTKQNFEVIFINDGSSDNTENVLKKYLEENMRYYTYKNQGVSVSRNIGIEKSKSKFITFMDVDDEYEDNFIEKMYEALNIDKSDVAICNYYEQYSNKRISKRINTKCDIMDEANIKSKLIPLFIGPIDSNEEATMAAVWRTMISRKLLIDNNIRFITNMKYSEDVFFIINVLALSKKVSIIHDCLYRYYKNDGSALNKYVEEYIDINLEIHNQYRNIIKKYDLDYYVHDRYEKNKFKMYTVLLSNAVRQKEKKDRINEIKKIIGLFYSQPNDFEKIVNNLTWYERVTLYLIKFKFIHILYLCYFFKEKRRMKKLN